MDDARRGRGTPLSDHGSVRSATVADAAGVLAIYAPVVIETAISFEFEPPGIEEFAERMMSVMRDDPWLVTEDNGMITGYAYATPFRSRAAYSQTRETSAYIHPDYHRRGLGRVLMVAVIDELVSRGVHRVVAGATLPNPGSAALHESLGFRYVGTFHEVGRKFDTWHDVGFWELDLA
jgi:phosphinothricin acetyltransferase